MPIHRSFKAIILGAVTVFAGSTCGRDTTGPPVSPGGAPSLTAISPADRGVLTGAAVIEVQATEARSVTLEIDDLTVGELETPPFTFSWDTRAAANGPHQVRVTARNSLGTADSVFVLVSNNPGRGIAVLVSPRDVLLDPGDSQAFSATVLGTQEQGVTWQLLTPTQDPARWGLVVPGGVYDAPASAPTPSAFFLSARSTEDPTRSATARIEISSIVVRIAEPPHRTVFAGESLSLSAVVDAGTSQSVTWSVDGSPEHGTITPDGIYHAPTTVREPLTVTVRAASVERPSRKAALELQVVPGVYPEIVVTPDEVDVPLGGQVTFHATVTGLHSTEVTWAVEKNYPYGIITPDGIYTAPDSPPQDPRTGIRATSLENPSVTGTAYLRIGSTRAVLVSVSPSVAHVPAGGTAQFDATVTGAENTGVTWSLESTGSGDRGSISSTGLYQAPQSVPSPDIVYVVATSIADRKSSRKATVQILPQYPAADADAIRTLADAGRLAVLIGEQAVELAVAGLRLAAGPSGLYPRTGILQWNGSGYDYLQDPTSTDLTIHAPNSTIVITTEIYLPDAWLDAYVVGRHVFVGSFKGRLRTPEADLYIDHSSGGSNPTAFERTVRGNLTGLPVTHLDTYETGYWDVGFHGAGASHHVTGTAETPLVQLNLDEWIDHSFGQSCYLNPGQAGESWSWRPHSTARRNGVEWSLDGSVETYLAYDCSSSSNITGGDFNANGSLQKEGIEVGAISSSGPVQPRAVAPHGLIVVHDGPVFPLASRSILDRTAVIANPLPNY